MTASTSIFDYVGRGTHAARPVSPNINSGGTAVYFETDTTNTFIWSGSAWVAVTGSGGVTSVGASVPASSILSVSGSPVTTTGTLALTTTGTSGGIPYFFDANTLKTSAALTANLPVIGGGAGVAPAVGTRSGNTTSFATTTGALTSGHMATFDANGNLQDGGAPGAASPMVLVSTQTASSSSSLDWTGLSGFTTYRLIGRFLLPATDSTDLQLALGTGGGPTWATTNYFYSNNVSGQSGAAAAQSQVGTKAQLVFNVHNAAPGVASLDLTFTLDGSNNYVAWTGTGTYSLSAASNDLTVMSGWRAMGAALTGIRLIFNGAVTMTSGNASLYTISP